MPNLERYTTASGRCPVTEFLDDLLLKEEKVYYKTETAIRYFKIYGKQINKEYRAESLKKMDNLIWELRANKIRIFCADYGLDTILLLHCYRKKSQKCPPGELKQANQEYNDWTNRKEKNQNEKNEQ